jgi:RNA polymerase sigma-70 factor (ECF subfamily)
MDGASQSGTRVSLLARLRGDSTDQQSWQEFVGRYAPRVYGWCRARGLQQADAEDVTQDVLITLARRMRSFGYDPSSSFRAWLHRVTCNALSDFLSERWRRHGPASLEALSGLAARDDLLAHLAEEFDQEVLAVASDRVKARVPAHYWEAFRLTALEGLSGADAAAQLGMKVATVFTAKSKVQRQLREEVQRLSDSTQS